MTVTPDFAKIKKNFNVSQQIMYRDKTIYVSTFIYDEK